MVPSLLTLSDVMGTGHHAARAAGVGRGQTVVVVGDGAVGLCAVLAARRLGAERVIAMSRHADRQAVAREFGADDIVAERGDEGTARIEELTAGVGADAVLECVGTKESMAQAIGSARPGGRVGYVGVPAGGPELPIGQLFGSNVVGGRRRRAGARLPARAAGRRPGRGDRPRAGLRRDGSRWPTSPTPTAPWTSGPPSRRCSSREPPGANVISETPLFFHQPGTTTLGQSGVLPVADASGPPLTPVRSITTKGGHQPAAGVRARPTAPVPPVGPGPEYPLSSILLSLLIPSHPPYLTLFLFPSICPSYIP